MWKWEGETMARLYAATRKRAWTWRSEWESEREGEARKRDRAKQAQGVWEEERA